jgi:hypothetical protein
MKYLSDDAWYAVSVNFIFLIGYYNDTEYIEELYCNKRLQIFLYVLKCCGVSNLNPSPCNKSILTLRSDQHKIQHQQADFHRNWKK